ncbi:hypothetical protein [Paracidovorax avenae]|uniref:hypothetical protein n=1 Tax=Paracidovorax avenae TaxID=80867 RepID=UPI001AD807B7|nr:hypothetical protein [Paracidovorax avenae]
MKIGNFSVAVAALALLTACGEKNTDASSPVAQTTAAPTPSTPSPEEKEKETLAGCSARAISIDPPSIEALEGLQGQMRCIENFLDDYKSTAHWQKAYADRAKAMEDSMVVVKALSGPPVGGDGDMANAQRALMDREMLKKLKSENYYFVKRAIEEITISIHHALFRELREAGMQMGNPKQKIEEANRMVKQTGVWGSSVDESHEGGQFVVTRWVSEKSPMFVIEGYGTTSVIIKIEDRYFDENGAFSEKCKVYLGVTQKRLSYDCSQYLSGTMGREVLDAMKELIKEDMALKASLVN